MTPETLRCLDLELANKQLKLQPSKFGISYVSAEISYVSEEISGMAYE